jgi:hypothetical protein
MSWISELRLGKRIYQDERIGEAKVDWSSAKGSSGWTDKGMSLMLQAYWMGTGFFRVTADFADWLFHFCRPIDWLFLHQSMV